MVAGESAERSLNRACEGAAAFAADEGSAFGRKADAGAANCGISCAMPCPGRAGPRVGMPGDGSGWKLGEACGVGRYIGAGCVALIIGIGETDEGRTDTAADGLLVLGRGFGGGAETFGGVGFCVNGCPCRLPADVVTAGFTGFAGVLTCAESGLGRNAAP